ncbi:MAG: hypothetical protein R3Y43_00700 [Alphaproteobacteria bacterium]
MLKSNLKIFIVLIVATLGVVLFSLWQVYQPKAGEKIFPANVTDFSVDGLRFFEEDGLWRIKEFDGYFADVKFVKNLLYVFDMAEYVKKDDVKKTVFNEVKIKNKKFKICDDFVNKGRENWLMSYSLKFPESKSEYLTSPMVDIDYMNVSSLKIGDVNWMFIDPSFIATLNNIKFVDVKRNLQKNKKRDLQVVLTSGLVINIAYYEDNWISISYDKLNIFEKGIKETIENYSILTDGWYFKLN